MFLFNLSKCLFYLFLYYLSNFLSSFLDNKLIFSLESSLLKKLNIYKENIKYFSKKKFSEINNLQTINDTIYKKVIILYIDK